MTRAFERRAFIKTSSVLTVGFGARCAGYGAVADSRSKELLLVEKGRNPLPIITGKNASAETRQAAVDLAEYIERISGARPAVVTDAEFKPERAIWVGIQPQLADVFAGTKLTFQYPEEMLIACNGRHLLIAGRDVMNGGMEIAHGTANAVYTFLQKYLDVRWLWPGSLGEDIVRKETIGIPVSEYRFHPQLLRREVFGKARRNSLSKDWVRYQRLGFDSLHGPAGGHAFTTWWERFHQTHPDWFALQPNGTRNGYPSAKHVKVCLSNPEVWNQWLEDASAAIEKDPALTMIMAGENDGHSSGLCVCKNCRAWDHPAGAPWTFSWEGQKETSVATTDRYITFWNQIARKLKARFPERKDLYVQGLAYGPSTPPPVKAVPDNNVIVSYVGKFPTVDEKTRQSQKAQFKRWAEVAPHLFYRPNLWYWTGGAWGLPDMALQNVVEDFRFLADNHCIGLFVDTAQEHWATQGPQYYLLAQLSWDPLQPGSAVLDDYYRRGFGPAADKVRDYWNLMDEARQAVTAAPNFGPNSSDRFNLLKNFERVYSRAVFEKAETSLRDAKERVSAAPEIYRQRLEFVRSGFEYTKLMVANLPLMTRVRESGGGDRAAVQEVSRNWTTIKELCERAGPVALFYPGIMGKMTGSGYMGMMEDYFGPPSAQFLSGSAAKPKGKAGPERTDID